MYRMPPATSLDCMLRAPARREDGLVRKWSYSRVTRRTTGKLMNKPPGGHCH